MAEISALVIPFFGLILLGYVSGRLRKARCGGAGLAEFLHRLHRPPALFFKIIGRTPIADLTRFDFILTSLAATYTVFLIAFLFARLLRKNPVGESTVQALAACYGNIGYLGPGLALAAFGEQAALPLALIFAFENMAHFIAAPALMALTGRKSAASDAGQRCRPQDPHPSPSSSPPPPAFLRPQPAFPRRRCCRR